MTEIKFVSWNLNSINIRIEQLLELAQVHNPDVVLVQETKAQSYTSEQMLDMGYFEYVNGQKSYNGVAIYSKFQLNNVRYNFCDRTDLGNFTEARFIAGEFEINDKQYTVISIYVPNGASSDEKFEEKLCFLNELYMYLLKNRCSNIIICGDYNMALEEKHVSACFRGRQVSGFRREERYYMQAIINLGYVNYIDTNDTFTWWDYRSNGILRNDGMLIDYTLVSSPVADNIKDVVVLKEYRTKERPSDHAPVLLSMVV